MTRTRQHTERHFASRVGWLRAAVLGANDGLLSTASLIVGVAAAASKPADIMVAGVAGLVAGAMSMAAGEYVSVSSQSDSETADLTREGQELANNPDAELAELAQIYVERGLDRETAVKVAQQLMAKDALAAHAHDELGLSEMSKARPVQAAITSAASFSVGAAAPLLIAAVAPAAQLTLLVALGSLVCLAGLGMIGARLGGAPAWRATARVMFWGALAMATTAGIGRLIGTAI